MIQAATTNSNRFVAFARNFMSNPLNNKPKPKSVLLIIVGVVVLGALFWFMNTYIRQFLASIPTAQTELTPSEATVAPGDTISINMQLSGETITAADVYITYTSDKVVYFADLPELESGFEQITDYFETPLFVEEITGNQDNTKTLHLVLISEKGDSDVAQFSLKFQAAAVGEAVFTIDTARSQLSGSIGDDLDSASYIGFPEGELVTTVNIVEGGSTITPTGDVDPTNTPTPTDDVPPTTATLRFEPEESAVTAGQTVTVNAIVDPANEQIAGVDMYISYDQNLLEFESVSNGDYFPLVAHTPTDNKIYISGVVDEQGTYKEGVGNVAAITFVAKDPTTTSISFDCDLESSPTSAIIKNDVDATNIIDCSSILVHNITISEDTSTPTPTPPSDTPTPIPTTTEQNANVTLDMKVRLQGVVTQPKESYRQQTMKVLVQSTDKSYRQEQAIPFTVNGDALWTGTMKLVDVPTEKTFNLFVKGTKHLQRKICTLAPTENVPGQYDCSSGQIELKEGINIVDMSNIFVLAGDIPIQNGIVDSVDVIYVRRNLGKTTPSVLSRADFNLDGIVDTQDYSLAIAALGFKYDEK